MRKFTVLIAISCLLTSSLLARRCALRTPARIQVPPAEIFSFPQQQLQIQQLGNAFRSALLNRQPALALAISSQMLQLAPNDPSLGYNHACLLAMQGQDALALQTLASAVKNGFNRPEDLQQNPQLASLRSRPGFSLLLRQAARNINANTKNSKTAATEITDRTATVTAGNTRWIPEEFSLVTEFQLPPNPPLLLQNSQTSTPSPAQRLVSQWIREGTAAGFHGLLYDNRDRDHSTLQTAEFPNLNFVEYAPHARAANADYGLRPFQRFNLPTIGNASTAYIDPVFARSNPRMLLSNELHTALTIQHWYHNQMYCYPEHRDYDPETGDTFPVNAPFWIVSQGSSGSDQPFMKAALLTLAALRPDVRDELQRTGRLMEITQWILRRSLRFVDPAGMQYLTGRAHPVVFQEADLDPERMVKLAHSLTPEQIPAVARLAVITEDSGTPDVDYFSGQLSEVSLNSPIALGRVYRTLLPTRKMTVQVLPEQLQTGRQPQIHWVVLQSGPEQVNIRPLNDDRSRAEITVNWGPAFDVPWLPGLKSRRVDVAVFIDDGVSVSLPGIISTLLPASETRSYSGNTLMSVHYQPGDSTPPAADPLLFPTRHWHDDYQYNNGKLTGWIRHTKGQPPAEFNQLGQLKLVDQNGQTTLVPVEYFHSTAAGQPPTLLWRPRNPQP